MSDSDGGRKRTRSRSRSPATAAADYGVSPFWKNGGIGAGGDCKKKKHCDSFASLVPASTGLSSARSIRTRIKQTRDIATVISFE